MSDRPAYLSCLHRRRIASKLHALGPRVLFELLVELGPDAEGLAEQYAERLTPEIVAATGADRFPPAPLHEVTHSDQSSAAGA